MIYKIYRDRFNKNQISNSNMNHDLRLYLKNSRFTFIIQFIFWELDIVKFCVSINFNI